MSPGLLGSVGIDLPQPVVDTLTESFRAIEDVLSVQTRSTVATVENVGSVTLEAGGKRLRPALVVLSALATGMPVESVRLANLSACMELIHMATLVHDDVIDGAATRRGKPTAASLYGNTAAILSGDVLLARAMRLLALDGDLRIIRAVSEAVVDLAEGEVMELEARGDINLTEERHLEILDKKTAALIACCCRVGAMCAASPQTIEDSLAKFGHELGLAFQITDDLLDFEGDSAKTGKPLGTDFRDGQATLPLIDLLTSPHGLDSVVQKFGNGVTDEEINQLCHKMGEAGSLRRVRERARTKATLAQNALTDLPTSSYTELLGAIAAFVTERQA